MGKMAKEEIHIGVECVKPVAIVIPFYGEKTMSEGFCNFFILS